MFKNSFNIVLLLKKSFWRIFCNSSLIWGTESNICWSFNFFISWIESIKSWSFSFSLWFKNLYNFLKKFLTSCGVLYTSHLYSIFAIKVNSNFNKSKFSFSSNFVSFNISSAFTFIIFITFFSILISSSFISKFSSSSSSSLLLLISCSTWSIISLGCAAFSSSFSFSFSFCNLSISESNILSSKLVSIVLILFK